VNPAAPGLGPSELQVLRSAGLVSARGYAGAIATVRDDPFWARWGTRALLALGAGQFLAGVVFFFAYNWNDLADVAKFAIVQAGLVIAAVGAVAVGLDRAFGQALLIAASVLAGVLLAVIGQVYQTGADAFELFAAWAALILPWAIISRSAAHCLIWLVVAEVALVLYGAQVLVAVGGTPGEEIWMLLGATIAAALAGRELAVRFGLAWLSGRWTRLLLLFAALTALFAPAAGYVLDVGRYESGPLCVGAFLLAVAVAAGFYWRVRPDFAAMVAVIGFADLFFICFGYRLIDEAIAFDLDSAPQALASIGAMIAWAIAGTGSAALAMRHLRGRLPMVPA
jgi:uncharacterized membrane protein